MSTQNDLPVIQIQGIGADVLIKRFEDLETSLNELKQSTAKPPQVELLTRKQVAKWLDISLPTLHSWTKKGWLKSYRIGNKLRYKKGEVLNALTSINYKG